jgi:hypothetical protein
MPATESCAGAGSSSAEAKGSKGILPKITDRVEHAAFVDRRVFGTWLHLKALPEGVEDEAEQKDS